MAIATLATTRYVEVGTYIGQFFLPGAGQLPNEVRVVCLVGKGDRNLIVKNNEIRRSFVYDELLTFSTIAPFIASLAYPADGNQSSPTSLRTSDGIEISPNKWSYVLESGVYQKIQILDSVYDPMTQFYLSYQSTSREVIDPIPLITVQQLQARAEIREIQALGLLQDQQEFVEYVDFVGTYELDLPAGDPSNSNPTTGFSTINTTAALGTGTLALNPSALYSHPYNRVYSVECTNAAGITPNRTAEFKWTSTPASFGNNALPSVPLNPAEDAPTFTLDETNPSSYTQLLELGVLLDLDFGATNYNIGDVFYLQGQGTSLIELDAKLLNTNQFTEFSAITPTLMPLSTGSVTFESLASNYVYTEHNLTFKVKCIDAVGVSPARTATFVWAGYGTFLASGSFTIDETTPTSLIQPLGASGIELSFAFGATNFVVGDLFSFTVDAPRLFYKGKESVRNIKFTVGAVTYPTVDRASIAGSFITDTPEGRYGNWSADTATNQGRFEIPDGLRYYIRNTYLSSMVDPLSGQSRLNTGDIFTMQTRFMSGIDFSLLREETQTFNNPSEIATDTAGAITGTVGAKYITLAYMPVEILSLLDVATMNPIAYTQVAGTSYLIITQSGFSTSTGDLICNYRWRGQEPAPGQVYYLTGKYLRPAEFYNRPFLFLSKTDMETFLAPSTIRNDLYIAGLIAWDYAIPGLFVIQAKDADDDGLYSREDFKVATEAFKQDRRATDLVVLNSFSSLPDQLQTVNICNDPFELHECMTWIGTPIGTPIGSEVETGSLVFLARKTLAVYGQSPAHGTRVLVGSTRATRTITLEDKSSTTVTLDGSFIAAALASLNSAFVDPKETVLFKQITSFDTMQTYTNPENMILGGNNIIFFADESNGIYRVKEDVTTDPFSSDTLNINQMVQKQFVTRDIRRTINNSLISMVFPSAETGVITLQSILAGRLAALSGNNLIGYYQDASGAVRDLDPATDAIVFRDSNDPTLFHIGYNYFLATTAKRVYGLYTVNLSGGFPR